jgi:methionyl-tRNA formyltransferase
MNRMIRLVLLTGGHSHAIRILKGLANRGIVVVAIVHEMSDNPHWPAIRSGDMMARVIALAKAGYRWVDRKALTLQILRTYRPLAERVVITGPVNSERMRADLEALEPDYILLGGIGILEEKVLKIARCGVINAHPGLLPWIRGTGVVAGALKRGIPVGGSCHWVNSGIDRGDIVSRRLVPIAGTETSLSQIERAANLLISDMMVRVVSDHLVHGERPEATAQTEKYPLCRWLSPSERAAMDDDIRKGLARRLFERWKGHCLDDELYYLPSRIDLADDLA